MRQIILILWELYVKSIYSLISLNKKLIFFLYIKQNFMYHTPIRLSTKYLDTTMTSRSNQHSNQGSQLQQNLTPQSNNRKLGPKHLSLFSQQQPDLEIKSPKLIHMTNSQPTMSSKKESSFIIRKVNVDDDFKKKEILASENQAKPNESDFYATHRNYDKLQDLAQHNKQNPNLYLRMLGRAEKNNLLPKKLSLLDTNSTEISAVGILSNPAYFEMFMEGLSTSSYKELKSLDLSCNVMEPDQIQKIANNLPQSLRKLNLSQTKLARPHVIFLNTLMTMKSSIMNLNLSRNMLGDSGIEVLVKGLWDNQMLEVLDITNNRIGDIGAQHLGNYIKRKQNLQELYIQYNYISGNGGSYFFEGLYKNQNLKVLDFSYNKLGGVVDCTAEICKVLAKPHPELVHMDLSKNSFTNEETQRISTDLAFNQIIYGFHYEGNCDYKVNSRGFLVKTNLLAPKPTSGVSSFRDLDQIDDQKTEEIQKITMAIEHLEIQNNGQVRQQIRQIESTNIQENVKLGDVCWICQGWVEIDFVYTPKKSGSIDSFPLFVHLEFEDYRPSLMHFDNKKFTLTRMCPPNQIIRYFFSNPVQSILSYARDQGTIHTAQYSQLRNIGIPLQYSDGTVLMSHSMQTINYLHSNPAHIVIDSVRHYIPVIKTKPRQPEKIVSIDPDLYQKKGWSLEKSFFKNYISDSNQRLEECLTKDMEFMKCTQQMKDYEPLKKEILPYYALIVQYYKFLVSQNFNNYESFPKVDDMGIRYVYDQIKQHVRQAEWTLILVTTQTIKQKDWKYMHELCLVRHQFIEIIFRVARYLNITFSQCMKQIFPFILDIENAQAWRDRRYWTQVMDLTIQLKLPLLKALFQLTHQFTFKKSIRPEKFNTLQDFKNLFFITDLLEKHVSEQEMQLIFLQSMQLQLDELNSAEHFEMTFIEFVEALTRMAEKISPRSPTFKVKDLNQQQRTTLPLYVKFEGLLYILFYRLKSRLTNMGFGGLEKTCVNNTITQSKFVKSQGINMEEDPEFSQSESETEDIIKQPKKSVYKNPEHLIEELLFDEHTIQPTLASQKSQSSFQFDVRKVGEVVKEAKAKGWDKVRRTLRPKTQLVQIPNNFLRNILEAEEKQKIIEQYHEEASSPLTKMRAQKRTRTIKQSDFKLSVNQIYQYDSVQDEQD
ncbi:hypothetical protein pb186bvf_002740 [Paramecium bursaria]